MIAPAFYCVSGSRRVPVFVKRPKLLAYLKGLIQRIGEVSCC